ncbi:hypothetical protein M422DRAFT_158428 [Sphaerobolus stellatus SS14]|nr:hypothetical protein M422DRAFT_158428 [Sphaerobolus stellatus SS14]
MEFFSSTYNALRGPTGAPQTAEETIGKLADRLSQNTLLGDRRAAVLSLKGLSRDWKAEVGEIALRGLLDILDKDAEIDSDIAKAVLETLHVLCDVGGGEGDKGPATPASRELGMKHTDTLLATPEPANKLFQLLGDTAFYTRFGTLQLLQVLLQNRKLMVQGYFIKSPVGFSNVVFILEEKREIIRNEGLIMLQTLISQNAEIQKILAFEGAFEKLFNIVVAEGGIEGGIVVQDSLTIVDGLLRFNVSNQSYFRETSLLLQLIALLFFPANLPPDQPAPQEFALQFWPPQKSTNANLIIGILGMLVGSKGGNAAEQYTIWRCLLELALASNAPTIVKVKALRTLPVNPSYPGSVITPYQPVPETNGEEWDKLEPITALDALVNNVVDGEYSGILGDTDTTKEALDFRTLSLIVFENFTRHEEVRLHVIHGMLPQDPNAEQILPSIASISLLGAITTLPTSPLSRTVSTRIHLATKLLASLLRSSPSAKSLVHDIVPSLLAANPATPSHPGSFFIPADGGPPADQALEKDEDEDRPQTLLQTIAEHLSLSFLSRAKAIERGDGREEREWDRVIVGYLSLLSQWLWENPAGVREFLEAGGLSVLVEPINQTSDIDPLVQGLSAFLLAVCYEFNRDSGEITRHTIHAIINRLSASAIVDRMAHAREEDRFKSIAPDGIVLLYPGSQGGLTSPRNPSESEIWLDWAFVEFWKAGFYTMQRAINTDPDAISASALENPEMAAQISSLREIIQRQAAEIDVYEQMDEQKRAWEQEKISLVSQLAQVQADLKSTEDSKKDAEKEQEDLLVFLEELSGKRKRDKQRMREAGLDVSEDEAEEEEE